MALQTSFGRLLRDSRRNAGITQRELAERAGVDFSYVSKLENDRLPAPAADTVVRFCEIIGVPAERLLALSRKIPSDVQDSISSSAGAQEFLRTARELRLSDDEWRDLRATVRRLREDSH
jgi:transcriptional regulator with XRE-family HTH domain